MGAAGVLLKKGKLLAALMSAKAKGEYKPLLVSLTITNRCNFSCTYCFGAYPDRYEEEKAREMRTADLLKLVGECAELGTQRIGITGGEPLLRDDLDEVVDEIRFRGMLCGLNTNGTLARRKIGLIRKMENVTISIDGEREANDRYRGKGTFDKAMDGIDAVLAAGVPLNVSMVVTRANLDQLDYVLDLGRTKGFRVQVSPLYQRFWGETREDYPEALAPDEVAGLVERVVERKRAGDPVFYSYRTYEHILAWGEPGQDRIVGKEPSFQHAECFMGKYMCTVDANGDVYPCAQLKGFKVKNVREVGLREAFSSIHDHGCKACRWACYNEFNLLMGLDRATLMSNARNALSKAFAI